MASALAPRSLSRAIRRKRWSQPQSHTSTRRIATAPAVERHEPEPVFPDQPPDLPRRQAISNAKPFSDFLTDTFDRQHDYLRISLTERCNLRCLYCMPEEGIQLSPNKELLTTAEIYYLSALFVNQGVNKIRLTGGEPTVRKDIIPLMQQIGSLRRNGLKEIALTTNGISLHRKLDDMVEAGLTGVNISLDTLDPHQFVLLTRRQGFEAVMKSINRVQEMNKLGASIKLKINCVAMRGLNDHQILPFIDMTRDQDVEVRFIEYMPFGGNKWSEKKMLPYTEMLDMIRTKYPGIAQLKGGKNDTSKTWQVPGHKGKVGFITSMTHNFCGTCNRLRITSDGNLKVCLHGNAEVSLRDMLRKDHDNEPMDEAAFEALRQIELDRRKQGGFRFDGEEGWISKERELLDIIGAAVKRKKARHAGMGQLENMKNRPMILIGEHPLASRKRVPIAIKRRRQHVSPSSNAAWSQLPLHLFSGPSASLQARCYSTDGRDAKGEETDRQETDRQEPEADTSNTPSRFSSMLGFQSLSGLFQQSPRGRYSRPTRSSTTRNSAPVPSKPQPEEVVPSVPEPSFVSETTASQPDEPVIAPIPQRLRYVSEGTQNNTADEPDSNLATHTGQETPERSSRHRRLIRTYGAPVFKSRPVPGRVANPFVNTRSPQRRKTSESSESWGLSKDTHQSLDSMLDPGLSNVEFKPVKESQQSPEVVPLDSSSVEKPAASTSGSSAPESDQSKSKLTHVTSSGEAHMVNVGGKEHTKRIAIAFAKVSFSNANPARLILENTNKKGDALGVARIAGIMASKRTADLIPLCHPIPISRVEVDVQLHPPGSYGFYASSREHHGVVTIHAIVECVGPTGVEMEALTAVSGAALTVFDMCKAVDRDIVVGVTKVMYKSGGRSGVHLHRKWFNYGGKQFLQKVRVDIDGLEATPVGTPARTRKPLRGRNIRRGPQM